jgi:aldose 1-epimerase
MKNMEFAVPLCGLILATVATNVMGQGTMSIQSKAFDSVDDQEVRLYTLTNENGMSASITSYGATVVDLVVPASDGDRDVALGFDSIADYQDRSQYFGCMVGRVGNRIAGGRFELDDERYDLAVNNDPNHLHGGVKGFDKQVWDVLSAGMTEDGVGLVLRYVSKDGEEGYPGTLTTIVEYELTNDDVLVVDVSATTDAATPVNIVHHSYWNLGGHDSGTILDHGLQLDASRYTPIDATLIPLGHLEPVEGTPLDFRASKPIGRDIGGFPASGDDPGGYDHNFVLDGRAGSFRRAARLSDPEGEVTMEIWTDQPGIQFYTGNFLNDIVGKDGAVYPKHGGLCLETQVFPDAINRRGGIGWPDPVLRPGGIYRHRMEHRFTY